MEATDVVFLSGTILSAYTSISVPVKEDGGEGPLTFSIGINVRATNVLAISDACLPNLKRKMEDATLGKYRKHGWG